jgi:membrane protease subunit HflC
MSMDRRWLLPLGILFALVIAWNTSTFTVPQWMQAVVVQLGDPVRTVREPGLYFKVPFVQEVLYFDKRLLDYDATPKEILTTDKQQMIVDNYSRWRIVDPLRFYKSVRTEANAKSRLDDIVYSNVRETLGRYTLTDIVSGKRAELMAEVTAATNLTAAEYGIEVADVRIKRADLPEKNELNVFNRMRTERERLAKKFRAEGEEQARTIRSAADRDAQILVAEARKDSEIQRGEGDALAVQIYADAYDRDPEFYELSRTLQAYRETIGEGTTLVLSPDSEFFRLLRALPDAGETKPAPAAEAIAPPAP